jgi:DNA invertase Pin-like site-specific DNA recombinase
MTAKSTTSKLRLDGIVRVSKTGEREYLRSPEQQKRDLQRWAKEQGHELVHVHVAIDESAGKGAHPAIEAAKKRALAGDVDGVVAPYLSRFSRNTVYGLETVQELLDANKSFFSLDCPFDLRTPEGEKYLTDKLAEARFEWRKARQNFMRAVTESIEDGRHLQARYGYRKANGKGSGLVAVPEEAKQVKRAFEMRAGGYGWEAIANALNESGASPRPYKRHGTVQQARWTHKTVRGVVQSDVYTGVAFNGPHRHEGAHEPIVSPEVFAAANETKGTKLLRPAAGYLLTGLVRCAGCGYAMTYKNEPHGLYLVCNPRQHSTGHCPKRASCPARPLEDLVWGAFEDYIGEEAAQPHATNGHAAEARERVKAAKQRSSNAMGLYALVESNSERELAAEQVKAAGKELRDAEEELQDALQAARGSRLPARLTVQEAREAPLEERRHWLSLLYRCVVVRKGVGYRESVVDRARVVGFDDAPFDGTMLRGWVAGQRN